MSRTNCDKLKPQDPVRQRNVIITVPDSTMILKELIIINDLVELIHLYGRFFGPIFLAAFSSIFICTTVQIFYCYIIVQNLNSLLYRTMWTFSTSMNMVMIQIILALVITSISEMIYNQVKIFSQYLEYSKSKTIKF